MMLRSIPSLKAGEYHYVRVVQEDEGAAWSSPIFVRGPVPAEAAADSVRNTEAAGETKSLP